VQQLRSDRYNSEWVTCLKDGWGGIGLIVPEIGGPELLRLKLARESLEEQQSLEQQLQRLLSFSRAMLEGAFLKYLLA
jgi:hypothetical protein